MKLQKLSSSNCSKIEGKKICCYEKSISYLNELCDKYDIQKRIDLVIDDNARNQGNFTFRGKNIQVCSVLELQDIAWDDYAIIITSDYHNEAYEKLSVIDFVSDKLEVIYYFANQETEFEEEYREFYKEHTLEDIIVFRSGPHSSAYIEGMDFGDNARALFEYLLKNGYNAKYKLIWFVKKPENFVRYSEYKNVSFVSFDWSVSEKKIERDAYYQALCLAKYIFFTDAYGFARNCRKDQIRVQLWHGCGFKTRVNFVRCEKRYEYTTVISDLYADIHEDIFGLRAEQLLVTGYAKQDWLFEGLSADKKAELKLPKADKMIFWLPTFRIADKSLAHLNEYYLASETGLPIVNTQKELEKLNRILMNKNMVLIIKLHPFQAKETVQCKNLSNVILLDNHELYEFDVQINQLLSEADALISDYSSAAVDYMLLDRPLAFTLEDVDEYEASRGFIFDNVKEWMPGKEIFSFEDLCTYVYEISDGVDFAKEKRQQLKTVMHKFADGNSCKRIAEALDL